MFVILLYKLLLIIVCTVPDPLSPSQLLVLSCQRLLRDIGYFRVILFTFYMEAGMAAVMLALGPQHYYFMAFYLTISM